MSEELAGFGMVLRAAREAGGLSQEELAERAGLSLRTIGNLERAQTSPYRSTVQRLADGLDLRGGQRAAFIAAAGRRPGRPGRPAPAAAVAHADPAGVVTPRQLPATVTAFVGRARELATLSQVLDYAAGTAIVAAVAGMAGVGKTALAVHWAHQVAGEFPDGQIYLNLRGFDPSGAPLRPADALRTLLSSLGVAGSRLPVTVDARLGLYRSMLTGKRVLIVLDNARDETQVRPLLPGSLTCRVIVTSRNQLTGLVATAAAHPVTLDVLASAEAHDLLSRRLGPERMHADPDAADRIIESSARLPLALCIVAARAATQPTLPLAQLADAITSAPGLSAFSTERDAETDASTVFSWSYRQLDADTARAFRLASLHPGQDIDQFTLAALAGTAPDNAARVLGLLASAYLIQPGEPGRYRMHDLLRRYGRELTGNDGPAGDRAALTRLFDYYLHTAGAAMDSLYPAERRGRPQVPPASAPGPVLSDPLSARAWLGVECGSLLDVVAYAAENGWPDHAARLGPVLGCYLNMEGLYAESSVAQQHALRAAQRTGDKTAEAGALLRLAQAYRQQDHHEDAVRCYTRALAVAQAAGDPHAESRALHGIGHDRSRTSRYAEAETSYQQALALAARAADPVLIARSLYLLGINSRVQGRHDDAIDYYQRALAAIRGQSAWNDEVAIVSRLGRAWLHKGDYQQAETTLRLALRLCRETSDKQGEATATISLGLVHLAQGDPDLAAAELRLALGWFRDLGDLWGQADALNGLGEAYLSCANFQQARDCLAEAVELTAKTGFRPERARALLGLGNAHHGLGETDDAWRQWRQALAIYTDLGAPEADRVRAAMAESSSVSD